MGTKPNTIEVHIFEDTPEHAGIAAGKRLSRKEVGVFVSAAEVLIHPHAIIELHDSVCQLWLVLPADRSDDPGALTLCCCTQLTGDEYAAARQELLDECATQEDE